MMLRQFPVDMTLQLVQIHGNRSSVQENRLTLYKYRFAEIELI